MSSSQLTTEMTKVEQAFVNIFGKKPAYMRPPYLETGGSVTSVMKTLGYKIITDDVDTQDWNGASVSSSEAKFTGAGASGNGHIPLMHETYQSTATTLTTWLIDWAKQNNLKIVTVCGPVKLPPSSSETDHNAGGRVPRRRGWSISVWKFHKQWTVVLLDNEWSVGRRTHL